MRSEKRPKPVRVTYHGPETLVHPGVVPKGYRYDFPPGVAVEVAGVPIGKVGQPIPPAEADERAVAWDDGDIEFFRRKAQTNPEAWSTDDKPSALERVVKAVKPKGKDAKEDE